MVGGAPLGVRLLPNNPRLAHRRGRRGGDEFAVRPVGRAFHPPRQDAAPPEVARDLLNK